MSRLAASVAFVLLSGAARLFFPACRRNMGLPRDFDGEAFWLCMFAASVAGLVIRIAIFIKESL